MKLFFLIGSVVTGAAMALGFTETTFILQSVLITLAGFGGVWVVQYVKTLSAKPARARYVADKESNYSELDVRDVFEALSAARARMEPPVRDAAFRPATSAMTCLIRDDT